MKPIKPGEKLRSATKLLQKQLDQAVRLMGGPPPAKTCQTMTKAQVYTPGMKLNLGMDTFNGEPPPPPPVYTQVIGTSDGFILVTSDGNPITIS